MMPVVCTPVVAEALQQFFAHLSPCAMIRRAAAEGHASAA
jgi:hypothetical protein